MKDSSGFREKIFSLNATSSTNVDLSLSKITVRRKKNSLVNTSGRIVEESEENITKSSDSLNQSEIINDNPRNYDSNNEKKKQKRKKKHLYQTENDANECSVEKQTEACVEEETSNLHTKKSKIKSKGKKSIKYDTINPSKEDTSNPSCQFSDVSFNMKQNNMERSTKDGHEYDNFSEMREKLSENEEINVFTSPSIKNRKRKHLKENHEMGVSQLEIVGSPPPCNKKKKKKSRREIDESNISELENNDLVFSTPSAVLKSTKHCMKDNNLKADTKFEQLPFGNERINPNIIQNKPNVNDFFKQKLKKVEDKGSHSNTFYKISSTGSPLINKKKKEKSKINLNTKKFSGNDKDNDDTFNISSNIEIKNASSKKNKVYLCSDSQAEPQIDKNKQKKSYLCKFERDGAEEILNPYQTDLQSKVNASSKSIIKNKNYENNNLTEVKNVGYKKKDFDKLTKKKQKFTSVNNIDEIRMRLLKQALNDRKQSKNTCNVQNIFEGKVKNNPNVKTALRLKSKEEKSETCEMPSNKFNRHKKKSHKKPDDIDKLTFMLISKALRKVSSSKHNNMPQNYVKTGESSSSEKLVKKTISTPLVHFQTKKRKQKHHSVKEKSKDDIEKIQQSLLSNALKQFHTE